MAANPSPSEITAPVWNIWEETKSFIPGLRLGGIVARKPGYHESVNANFTKYAGNYSIKYVLDFNHRNKTNGKFSRAIDLTMSDAEMRKRTGYLIKAADSNDPRMFGVREFYGTLDSKSVTGRIRNDSKSTYRFSSADSTHLWHIHTSFWAEFVDDWLATSGFISILKGESLASWISEDINMGDLVGLKHGDGFKVEKGDERVKHLQSVLGRAGHSAGEVDGKYGDGTATAVLSARKAQGSSVTNGKSISGWAATQIYTEFVDRRIKLAVDAMMREVAKSIEAATSKMTSLPESIVIDLPDQITVPISPVNDSDE